MTDMTGESPKRILAVNLSTVRFYVLLASAILALFGMVLGGASVASQWALGQADQQMDDRIEVSVQPPAGIVYTAIEDQVQADRREVEDHIESIERQMIRQDYMMSMVYQTVTGLDPPPRVE